MTDREKLIELLQHSPTDAMGNHGVGAMADHFLANGVTIPVRCKDCVFCHYNSSNETYKCSTMNGMYRTVEPNEFCFYGERKDNG